MRLRTAILAVVAMSRGPSLLPTLLLVAAIPSVSASAAAIAAYGALSICVAAILPVLALMAVFATPIQQPEESIESIVESTKDKAAHVPPTLAILQKSFAKSTAKLIEATAQADSVQSAVGGLVATGIQITMGAAAIFQIVVLLRDTPTSLVAVGISVVCAAVQAGDAFSFVLTTGMKVRAIQVIAEKANSTRVWLMERSMEFADTVMQRIVKLTSKASVNRRVRAVAMLPSTLDSETSENVAQLKVWFVRNLNETGYKIRQSPLKVLIAILNTVAATDGATEQIRTQIGVALHWLTSAVSELILLVSNPAQLRDQISTAAVDAEHNLESRVEAGMESFAWADTVLDPFTGAMLANASSTCVSSVPGPACNALGAGDCGDSSLLWAPDEDGARLGFTSPIFAVDAVLSVAFLAVQHHNQTGNGVDIVERVVSHAATNASLLLRFFFHDGAHANHVDASVSIGDDGRACQHVILPMPSSKGMALHGPQAVDQVHVSLVAAPPNAILGIRGVRLDGLRDSSAAGAGASQGQERSEAKPSSSAAGSAQSAPPVDMRMAAAVAGAATTVAASSDFVRRHTRPNEYEAGLAAEKARRRRLQRRARAITLLQMAMANPPKFVNLRELSEAISFAEGVDLDMKMFGKLLDEARVYLGLAVEADELRKQLESALLEALSLPPLERDVASITAAIDDSRDAGSEAALIESAVESLKEAMRLQDKHNLAVARLEQACTDHGDEDARGLMIDIGELESAIAEARESMVAQQTVAFAQATLTYAIDKQKTQAVGVAKVYGTLRAKAKATRERTSARTRLEQAESGVQLALETLRRESQAGVLDLRVAQLGEAIAWARETRCDKDDIQRSEGTHATATLALQHLASAQASLRRARQASLDAICDMVLYSNAAVSGLLSNLSEALALAKTNYVDVAEVETAQSDLSSLQTLHTRRERASFKLAAALAKGIPSAEEIEKAIKAAVAAHVDREIMTDARRRLHGVYAIAHLDAAVVATEAAGKHLRRSGSPEGLSKAIFSLAEAYAAAEAAGVDEDLIMGHAQFVLVEAQSELSGHLAAVERLHEAVAAVEIKIRLVQLSASAGFQAKLDLAGELTVATKELEEAMEEASAMHVINIREAIALMAKAKEQLRRFI